MKRLATILALLVAAQGWAISITNIASGSWTNPAIWSPAQIPTFADESVITGYTVTVHSRPINVGTFSQSAGTLTLSAGYSIISNAVNMMNGGGWTWPNGCTVEVAGAICNVGTTTYMAYNIPNVPNSRLYFSSSCVITCLNDSSRYWPPVSCANTGKTVDVYGGGWFCYPQPLFLNGGTLNGHGVGGVISSSFYTRTPSNSVNAASGSTVINFSNGLGWDSAILTNNVSPILSGSTFSNNYFAFTFNAGVAPNRYLIIITNCPINCSRFASQGAVYMADITNGYIGSASDLTFINTYNFSSNVPSVFTNSTLFFDGYSTLNVGYSPLTTIVDSTITFTNKAGAASIFDNGTLTGGSPLKLTRSTLNVFSKSITVPASIKATNWSNVTVNQTGGSSTFNFRGEPISNLTVSGSGSITLSGAITAQGLTVLSNGTSLRPSGYTLTTSTTSNYSKLIGSNSTILVDQALVNVGASGVFSQMTSTVQFGTTTNAASCNVTNFYNLLCNTPGKSVTLTNSKTVIQGTLASTGLAASNVTWTGGATLTLSNKAYLFSTSPYIRFAGKDVEVWDAAGGTNQLGTGDYWPR